MEKGGSTMAAAFSVWASAGARKPMSNPGATKTGSRAPATDNLINILIVMTRLL